MMRNGNQSFGYQLIIIIENQTDVSLMILSTKQETPAHINIASYFIFRWGDCFYNTSEFQSKFYVK